MSTAILIILILLLVGVPQSCEECLISAIHPNET